MKRNKYKYKLSVLVICYNHEKYFKQAWESIINQKTNFDFEVIVCDDCSTDNSQKVIKECTKGFKNLKLMLRKKNCGATYNSLEMRSIAEGEYISVLESDDYWLDENRLQILVDFLDEHPEYVGVSHKQLGVDINGKKLGSYPRWIKHDTETTIKDFLNEKYYSSSSAVYRNLYDKMNNDKYRKLFLTNRLVGDIITCNFVLDFGKVYIINKDFMAYRVRNSKSESNYNSIRSGFQKCQDHIKILNALDEYYAGKYNYKKIYNSWLSQAYYFSLKSKQKNEYKMLKKNVPKRYLRYHYFNFWKPYLKAIKNKIVG